MDSPEQKDGLYVLPIYQVFKFRWYHHLMFGVFVALLLVLILLPSYGDPNKQFANVMAFIGILLLGSFWVVAFHAETYLKVTDEYLEYKYPFGHKILPLKDIKDIQIYCGRSGVIMGIEAAEGSITKYFIRIPANQFPNLYLERLRSTIFAEIDRGGL